MTTPLTARTPIRSSVWIEGKRQYCSAEMEEELLRIAQSAVSNAVLHSQGSQVHLQLTYRPESITLRISDDGCGIAPEILKDGRPGHFGLKGMRERAERIGAEFSIISEPGAGASVFVIASIRSNRTIRSLSVSLHAAVSRLRSLWKSVFESGN